MIVVDASAAGSARRPRRIRIERYPHHLFLPRIWSLRANATAYDACYLALAEALDAPLLTTDRQIASVPGDAATVEVVS